MADGWIAVVGWDEMTHADATRRGRGPLPWVKTYTRLLDDAGYSELTAHQRGVYHGIVLSYASSACQLAASTSSLSRKINARVSSRQLESLIHAGLIRVCASLAQVSVWHETSPTRAREELEVEINPKDVREGANVERPQDFTFEENGAEPSEMPELEQPASELVESDNDPAVSLADRLSKGIPF